MMRANSSEPESALSRQSMVAQVEAMAEELADKRLPEGQALSSAVLDALGRVPRHRFVPEVERDYAYQNRPLPIGYGQTISQPFIVAYMTDLLRLQPGSRVLEVGTGCGYQSAVMAEMGAEVYTVEIVEPLAKQSSALLQALGYDRVHVRSGDGYAGWAAHAPFDAIMVTAGADAVPPPLLDQLKPGGRMVIPLGAPYATQALMLIEKGGDGAIQQQEMLPVRFVPLTGKH